MNTQMDLLAWEPPCTILLFPLARRVGKVRRCAEVLVNKRSPSDALYYWRSQVLLMSKQLAGIGCKPDRIDEEIRAFHDHVQKEIARQALGGRKPTGAA